MNIKNVEYFLISGWIVKIMSIFDILTVIIYIKQFIKFLYG